MRSTMSRHVDSPDPELRTSCARALVPVAPVGVPGPPLAIPARRLAAGLPAPPALRPAQLRAGPDHRRHGPHRRPLRAGQTLRRRGGRRSRCVPGAPTTKKWPADIATPTAGRRSTPGSTATIIPIDDCVQALSESVFRGFGEVEFHLHHGHDTHETMAATLRDGLNWFGRCGAMRTAEARPRQ